MSNSKPNNSIRVSDMGSCKYINLSCWDVCFVPDTIYTMDPRDQKNTNTLIPIIKITRKTGMALIAIIINYLKIVHRV